ncbi:MAG: molybdenum ABC transporter ATP-binding protein [Pseudomonadota bacterium]
MSGSNLLLQAKIAWDGFDLDLDETIPLDGVTAVFGASGSGKTSLLNLIAGFLRPTSGRVMFNQSDWYRSSPRSWVPPHQRSVGTVFQDAQLFPHLTVRGNLDYAAKRADPTAAGHSFSEIVSVMALSPLLDRQVGTLSGGEAQRIALARTLLTKPQILLLDEPLSALDTARKSELLPFLETAETVFNLPTLYVSHDVDEVSRIADRVLVMEAGRVIARGRPDEVLSRFGLEAGRNPYEIASVLTGQILPQSDDSGLTEIKVGDASIWLAVDAEHDPGAEVQIKIAARDVAIATQRPDSISIQNMIAASVTSIEETKRPAFRTVTLDIAGQTLKATITRKAVQDLALVPDQQVFALIKSATFNG